MLEPLPNELWKKLEESEGCYISNYGRLYRAETTSIRRDHNTVMKVPAKQIVGPKLSTKGYSRVTLRNRQYQVHRLVGKYFIPNPYNKPQINHIDGNKTNNTASNLEWVTNQENRDHAVAAGLVAHGFQIPNCKLSPTDKDKIKELYIQGYPQRKIAAIYSITQQTVSKVVRG